MMVCSRAEAVSIARALAWKLRCAEIRPTSSSVRSTFERSSDPAEIPDPKHVKTVFNQSGQALYFSRSPIPCYRDGGEDPTYYKHLGIYAYFPPFLRLFSDLPTGPLEAAEKLEQLRALEYGYSVKVIESKQDSFEVDVPEDLLRRA